MHELLEQLNAELTAEPPNTSRLLILGIQIQDQLALNLPIDDAAWLELSSEVRPVAIAGLLAMIGLALGKNK